MRDSGKRRGGRLVRMAFALYGGMALVGLLWAWFRGLLPGWWRFDAPNDAVAAGLAGICLGTVALILTWTLEHSVDGVQRLSERFATILAGTRTRDALILAGLSSVGEEVLFRGCLQQELGWLPATALFALAHIGPERVYLWWTASAFAFGLGLAMLFEHHGGLMGPILMHFVINAVNLRLLGLRGERLVKRRTVGLGDL